MSKYIDCFVLPIHPDRVADYCEVASRPAAIWMEHGALEYTEALGDDLDVKEQVPFPRLVATRDGESVVVAYIIYGSREHRDAVNAKVMADPRFHEVCHSQNPPFDHHRMAYGGFRAFVEG